MDDVTQVLAAATARARALGSGDADRLASLLHESFRWTTHTGRVFTREEYVARNTDGTTVWRSQVLDDPHVVVSGDTAVVWTGVTDTVVVDGEPTDFRMPVTQTWVREDGRWRCLAGHAGPRA